MANIIEQRLKELSIELDEASVPAGSYVPYVVTNNLVFISGQLPFINGALTIKGRVGEDVTIDDAIKMSEACAKALLSWLKAACNGKFDRVKKVVKLGGFETSSPDFTDQPKVINGASDLIVNIFGDKGKHARFAVGVAALPLNVPVEIDGVFEIEE